MRAGRRTASGPSSRRPRFWAPSTNTALIGNRCRSASFIQSSANGSAKQTAMHISFDKVGGATGQVMCGSIVPRRWQQRWTAGTVRRAVRHCSDSIRDICRWKRSTTSRSRGLPWCRTASMQHRSRCISTCGAAPPVEPVSKMVLIPVVTSSAKCQWLGVVGSLLGRDAQWCRRRCGRQHNQRGNKHATICRPGPPHAARPLAGWRWHPKLQGAATDLSCRTP